MCLGISTIQELYEVIETYEGAEFAATFRNFIHGRADYALSQTAEIKEMNQEEIDVEIRSEKYQQTLEVEARKVHENKLKRIGKLENIKIMTLPEAKDRLSKWNAKTVEEKSEKKSLRLEKKFWSDQLRKAHNTREMTYKRFDGSSDGIVGVQYSVDDKAKHLIHWLELQQS